MPKFTLWTNQYDLGHILYNDIHTVNVKNGFVYEVDYNLYDNPSNVPLNEKTKEGFKWWNLKSIFSKNDNNKAVMNTDVFVLNEGNIITLDALQWQFADFNGYSTPYYSTLLLELANI